MDQQDYKIYETYYNQLAFEPIMIEYRRKAIIENLTRYKHERILEIGCGNEPIFKYFSDYKFMTVVEPCESFYKNAFELKKGRKNIELYNDIFENVSGTLNDEKIDFIIVSCLLHEIQDTTTFLEKLHSICNESTIVHLSVPNANSFHRLLALEMGIIENLFDSSSMNMLMRQRVYNLSTLTELLSGRNFRILESGSYFIKPFTHIQMQQLVDLKIIRKRLMDGLYGMSKYIPEMGSEIYVNCSMQKRW